MRSKYLYFAVFCSGMVTLAVEISASRLLGAVFGTSNLVWASIIGLILIYLTAGYFFGGAYADRRPEPSRFYRLLLLGGFFVGVVPLASRPVLRAAADAFDHLEVGVLLGAFSGVLVLFIVPISILGMVSPFAIRLGATKAEETGRLAGRMYGLSTLGSFVGTFLPDLLLIPLIGTTRTFLVLSAILMLVGLIGHAGAAGWRRTLPWLALPGLLLTLAVLLLRGGIKDSAGMIFETESSYNYIQVLEADGYRYLRLNEGQGVHSIYHPDDLDYDGPWEQFLAGPFFNPDYEEAMRIERIAIVGLAAGTVARQATAVFGPVSIDGFEIDARIIQVGQDYFGMTMPNLNAIAQDGRWGLAHSGFRYDLIAVDAYRPPYIPWHLTTREFFEVAAEHLTDDGVLVINVGRAPEDRRLIDALVSTLAVVFPSVHVMDIPYTFNTMVYATVQPTSFDDLAVNFNQLALSGNTHPLLLEVISNVLAHRQPLPVLGEPLTDDHAPVEWIINSMVLRFMLSGDYQEMQ
ncbi:MAG: fused MFS/spermidine synthase [Chloroflexi bacterium]|nr:fused MFS/spermidine synthase [Chloroflexota bacterium]